jgi:hypothetical protein
MASQLRSIRGGKKPANGFSVNACSVCEEIVLTVGNRRFGGIRYCEDCLKSTLGWIQLHESQRERITKIFRELRKTKRYAKEMASAANVDDETKKSISIGEAHLRVFEAAREEW